MGNYTIFFMFENPRGDRQARNFTTNVPKIPDLKSSSEQIFTRKLTLGTPEEGIALALRASWEASRVTRLRFAPRPARN